VAKGLFKVTFLMNSFRLLNSWSGQDFISLLLHIPIFLDTSKDEHTQKLRMEISVRQRGDREVT